MKVKDLIRELLEFDMDLEVGIYQERYQEVYTVKEEWDVEFPCEEPQTAVIIEG